MFAITKPGLLAITLSVLALWSCVALEALALRQAAMDAQACRRTLQDLRERSVPVSDPVPFRRHMPTAS